MRICFILSVLLNMTIFSPSFAMNQEREFDEVILKPQAKVVSTQTEPGLEGLLPEVFNLMTARLDLDDINNLAPFSKRINGLTQYARDRLAAKFLIEELKIKESPSSLANYLWTKAELNEIKLKGLNKVPQNAGFMRKIYVMLKNKDYPLECLNHIIQYHLPSHDNNNPRLLKQNQTILSHAPQLLPKGAVFKKKVSIIKIPTKLDSKQLKERCVAMGKHVPNLLPNKDLYSNRIVEMINQMLLLDPQQMDASMHAILKQIQFIKNLRYGHSEVITQLLELEPHEISERLEAMATSTSLDSLDDKSTDLKGNFIKVLLKGDAAQIKAFTEHFKNIQRNYQNLEPWIEITRHLMTLRPAEISRRMAAGLKK